MTSGVSIRPLAGLAERQACVDLQEQTWGRGFPERVPASMLLVAQEMGGVVSGAFDGDRLVGFVFGITGLRDGRPCHWSDMLAVRPEYRGRGIGLRLKRHQRDQLLGLGVERVLWTFDPLVARNAHLNLNRLGATAGEYRRDLYGDSSSPLHAGIGTDRLVAEWLLNDPRVVERLDADVADDRDGAGARSGAPPDARMPAPDLILNPAATGGPLPRPAGAVASPEGAVVGVVVPADLQSLKARDLELARQWRLNVRTALESCVVAGFRAVAIRRGTDLATYVLTRDLER